MKMARRMINGIGIPINQRRSPRPKPMFASCLLGDNAAVRTWFPGQEPNYFHSWTGTNSAECAQLAPQHFAGGGHRKAVGKGDDAWVFVRGKLDLDEVLDR
jgi:hypothetical protein